MPHDIDADEAAQPRQRRRDLLREGVEHAALLAVATDAVDIHAVEADDAPRMPLHGRGHIDPLPVLSLIHI